MLEMNAVFVRKESDFEPQPCVIEKIIRLSDFEYDRFAANMLAAQDFIEDNAEFMQGHDSEGRVRCLLVVCDGRRDGILVDSDGGDYARRSAFVPNAEDFLNAQQYPALADLNRKLTLAVDYIASVAGTGSPDGRGFVKLQDSGLTFGIDFTANPGLRDILLGMLGERPEIRSTELDEGKLIICREPGADAMRESLIDQAVSRTDMYAYGYSWDGMIPLGKEHALMLFDKGHEVFRLYQSDAEGVADTRDGIEDFYGLFGVEDPAWEKGREPANIEVFIHNPVRYRNAGSEARIAQTWHGYSEIPTECIHSGEWLTLPTDADTLRGLFERIGVDSPGEDAFKITAIRVPQEDLRDFVSTHDSLDELNILATYVADLEDFEIAKLEAILARGRLYIGRGTPALLNILDPDNFDAFELVDADNVEALGRYHAFETGEKPDGVSYKDYGNQVAKEAGGVFTEWGYLCFRNKELSRGYVGVVPDEYKIVDKALGVERSKTLERQSVRAQLRAAKDAARNQRGKAPPKSKRDKGGPEL